MARVLIKHAGSTLSQDRATSAGVKEDGGLGMTALLVSILSLGALKLRSK